MHAAEWVILASGPSLTVEDVELVRKWREADPSKRAVIAVNYTFRRAPWADVLFAIDDSFWDDCYEEARAAMPQAELVTSTLVAARKYPLKHIPALREVGLSPKRGWLCVGANSANSGTGAISLAYEFGAWRIVLLGLDMQATGGRQHWYEDPRSYPSYEPRFPLWIADLNALAVGLEAAGVSAINASRATALTCFRMMPLEQALGMTENDSLRS